MIRSFIALELNDQDTIEKIQSFGKRLISNQPNLKLVEPQNLHMTVKFLGNIEEFLAPKIYKILEEEINEKMFQGNIYEFKLKGTGQFRNYSIIWIKLIGNIQFLQDIKDNIESLLNQKLKIEKDKRTKFTPHLTMGRLKYNKINYKNIESFKNLLNENKHIEFGPFNIKDVKLKKSVLTPKGPIYYSYKDDSGFEI
ncbi:MAG: RNA 2',3'-cyclic phosphodiesterase [Promethearchaeota archaeon]